MKATQLANNADKMKELMKRKGKGENKYEWMYG